MPPTLPGLDDEETTSVRIRLAELEARRKEARGDYLQLDTDVRKLEAKMARLDERLRHVQRAIRWAMGLLAAVLASRTTTLIKVMIGR